MIYALEKYARAGYNSHIGWDMCCGSGEAISPALLFIWRRLEHPFLRPRLLPFRKVVDGKLFSGPALKHRSLECARV